LFIIRIFRAQPFSIMALCNIVGDLGYLGYAFAADGFISLPKLAGACFTMLAHTMLLAYGDDQARMIAAEQGLLPHIFFGLRVQAKRVTLFLPKRLQAKIQAKPVGIPFLMLAVNGVALFMDAVLQKRHLTDLAAANQVVLGVLITLGCGAFAIADLVKGQKVANILTKTAPAILVFASVANMGLAITTGNPFVIISVVAFVISNGAGFFTHIDKEKGQHLHS
jgi:hypothetical protein